MSRWICDLAFKNNDLTLNDLLLPGTHNSCSNKMEFSYLCFPIYCIIQNWTLNQNLSVYNQLKLGVRVLDIDVSFINDTYYTSHSFILDNLNSVMRELILFNSTINDIYILKIICRDNINNKNVMSLYRKLEEVFYHNIIYTDKYTDVLNKKIIEFINNKKNMIIYMDYDNHLVYNTDKNLYSSWTNDRLINNSIINNKIVLNKMKENKNINNNKFNDLNWTLTPTYKEILNGLFCCFCDYNNIKTWIKNYNPMFKDFYNKNKMYFNNVNSISFDFINKELINYIIKLNFKTE